MNPLTNVKNITKLNQIELERGTVDKKSWHDIYKESAWIFIGGLAYGLTEGDILSVFSQYGEVVNINLVRDKKTGKTKGFCFLCYANQKSTILAVDNFNGIKVCGRTIRVDHVANYKPPKENEDEDDITKQLKAEGCAPRPIKQETSKEIPDKKKCKKIKKEKKKHKKKDIKQESVKKVKVKQEKYDPGYDKHELPTNGRLVQKGQGSESEDSESSSDGISDYDSSHASNRQSGRTKIARKDDRVHLSSESRYNEPNRNKSNTNDSQYTHKTNDSKRRRADSSSDESVNRKKSHITDSSKGKRSESSVHRSSVNADMSPDPSFESSKRYSANERKSKDSKHCEGSTSFKDKHSSKLSQQHRRYDSSSSERDTIPKHKLSSDKRHRESEKSYTKHHDNRAKKDSYHKSSKDYHPSSSSKYHNSDEKYIKSKQSYENDSSSTSSHEYSKNKNHRYESKSNRMERKER